MDPGIVKAITIFVAFLLSLTVHEAAHAWMAKRKGDLTAEQQGRLTLNPIAHIDPIGTLLMPILGVVLGGFVFAWAKPVPVDLRNLRNPRPDHAWIAAAGPLSNILLCVVFAIIIGAYNRLSPGMLVEGDFFYPLLNLASAMVFVNAILAIFNLIPLPPLDGGAVMSNTVLPLRWAEAYERYISPYGFMILLMMMLSGGLGWVSSAANGLIAGVTGIINILI